MVDHILSQGGFERYTPCGQSIFEKHADRGYAYEFAEDHLITRDIVVVLGDYDREFVRRDRIAYPWGKIFKPMIKNTAEEYPWNLDFRTMRS